MSKLSQRKKSGTATVGDALLDLARHMEAREKSTLEVIYTGWDAAKSLRRFERKYRAALKHRIYS